MAGERAELVALLAYAPNVLRRERASPFAREDMITRRPAIGMVHGHEMAAVKAAAAIMPASCRLSPHTEPLNGRLLCGARRRQSRAKRSASPGRRPGSR